MDSSSRIFFNWDWGFRLVPTDVPHPLLTSVYCPFNLLRSFKEGAHRSKTDFIILSDTHALHVRVWDQRKHHFLCVRVWDLRKCSKKMREHSICRLQRFFRHACMLIQTRTHNAGLSYRRMKSVLLRWVPSLSVRSKLKGQCTDDKSRCVTSVWPSLNPHSLS